MKLESEVPEEILLDFVETSELFFTGEAIKYFAGIEKHMENDPEMNSEYLALCQEVADIIEDYRPNVVLMASVATILNALNISKEYNKAMKGVKP